MIAFLALVLANLSRQRRGFFHPGTCASCDGPLGVFNLRSIAVGPPVVLAAAGLSIGGFYFFLTHLIFDQVVPDLRVRVSIVELLRRLGRIFFLDGKLLE